MGDMADYYDPDYFVRGGGYTDHDPCGRESLALGMTQDHRPWTAEGRKEAVLRTLRDLGPLTKARKIEMNMGWHPGTAGPVLVALRSEGLVVYSAGRWSALDEPALWRTREGQSLRPIDMTDSHIDNALRLALRNAQGMVRNESNAAWRFAMFTNGEMAEFYAEREAERLDEIATSPVESRRYVLDRPIIRALLAERSRRKRIARGKEYLF